MASCAKNESRRSADDARETLCLWPLALRHCAPPRAGGHARCFRFMSWVTAWGQGCLGIARGRREKSTGCVQGCVWGWGQRADVGRALCYVVRLLGELAGAMVWSICADWSGGGLALRRSEKASLSVLHFGALCFLSENSPTKRAQIGTGNAESICYACHLPNPAACREERGRRSPARHTHISLPPATPFVCFAS